MQRGVQRAVLAERRSPTSPPPAAAAGAPIADVSAVGDPNTGVDVYDSTPEFPGAPTGWGVWGGTSVSSPIVAAEFGLAGGSQGVSYPAATLYGHAAEASSFYDVLTGDNGKCAGTTICEATTGFDGPTGIGSPIGLGAFDVAGTPKSTARPAVSGFPEQGLDAERAARRLDGQPQLVLRPVGTLRLRRRELPDDPGGDRDHLHADPRRHRPPDPRARRCLQRDGQRLRRLGAGRSGRLERAAGHELSAPTTGITGSTIVVNGSALDSTSEVLVGNVAATFTIVSPVKLEVTVPNGAKKGKLDGDHRARHGEAEGQVRRELLDHGASRRPRRQRARPSRSKASASRRARRSASAARRPLRSSTPRARS